ncbi:hypothetical protein Tco_0763590, partial [Tanacetum coccineum]
DAANEDTAAANEAAGSAAAAHPVPYSPPVSPVREPTPERQPASERPSSPSPTPPAQTFSFEEPLVFGPAPRPAGPDDYFEPEDIDNITSMEDDTAHGGFHVESPVRPDDAPTPTTNAAGRAEDPTLLTSLSAKLDRCMGRIDLLETELGTTKKLIGSAILTLVSRVKKLERTVKQLRTARLVGDAPAAEGDVDIQDDVDIDGLSRMASATLGHDQPTVPSEEVEEREEEEVPFRRKRTVYQRARTEFNTPAFEQFQAPLSADVLPQAAVSESAGPSVAADKGKAPMPELDIPAEFLAKDAQARKLLEEEQASERLVHRLRAKDLAKEDLPNVSAERAKELDDLMMRMTETDWLNLMMQVGSNPALARELLGADVTKENFVERMTAIKEKKKRALADLRYRALKGKPMKQSEPAIFEPPSKRLRVDRDTSQPSDVPAATTQPVDDTDSAGGGSFPPAGSATPLSGSAAPTTAGDVFGVPDSIVTTSAVMDSAGSCRHIGVSPFADSAAGGINEFFLDSDEDEQIGMYRVAADPDSDNKVLAEIIFRGKSVSGHGVVIVDELPDDEIVDLRVKVETVSDYVSSHPRFCRKHIGLRGADVLWDKPVEDFFSSESDSDDDLDNYIAPLPYAEFKDWEMSLHSDDVEDFWRTQDEWVVSSWKLYPKSSVHILDLTNGKTVYMFVDKFYPIRATLIERMLRHRLTVPPSYCRDVVVAGSVIQTIQDGLRESYECLASAP